MNPLAAALGEAIKKPIIDAVASKVLEDVNNAPQNTSEESQINEELLETIA